MKMLGQLYRDFKQRKTTHFQNAKGESVLSMSGQVIILAARGSDQAVRREFHWCYPPLVLPDGGTESLAAGLSRMPVRVSVEDDWLTLSRYADSVIGLSCQDRASANVCFSGQVRSLVASTLPAGCLYEEEWCGLHNVNNMKVSSSDLCRMTAKYYSLAALMKAGPYVSAAACRIAAFVEDRLVRHPGATPSAATVALNRRLCDAIYDLESPHHLRKTKGGDVAKSTLLRDIEELLTLDCSPWSSTELVCYCWDSEQRRPKHSCLAECRDAFVAMYLCFYLGRGWPLPSVTKFTNMGITSKKVQFAYAHHNILSVLVEPYEYVGDPAPALLSAGSSASEFQVVHRVRKDVVHTWAIKEPDTRWKSAILSVITNLIDKLLYDAFGGQGEATSTHESLHRVAETQDGLCKLLAAWCDDASPLWLVLDAVTWQKRSQATDSVRAFARRNILLYASSMVRRFQLPLLHNEKPLHDISCERCSPSDAQRAQAWARMASLADCCKTFFMRRLISLYDTVEKQASTSARLTLQMRNDLHLRSTKVSESNHAHGQKLIGKSLKPLALSTFARKVFLARFRAAHANLGGLNKWYELSDDQLQARARHLPQEGALLALCALDVAVGDIQLRLADGVDLAPVALPALPAPKSELKKQRGLNPVLYKNNQKLKHAKTLGLEITSELRSKILAEVQQEYQGDPQQRQEMLNEYWQWLNEEETTEIGVVDVPLKSTYFGWGSVCLPIPMGAVQAFVQKEGVHSRKMVSSADVDDQFRVSHEECHTFVWRDAVGRGQACGATAASDCRPESLSTYTCLPPNHYHTTQVSASHWCRSFV